MVGKKSKIKDCIMCKLSTKGRGHYRFNYLQETVDLCGRCSQKVMKFIKGEKCNN